MATARGRTRSRSCTPRAAQMRSGLAAGPANVKASRPQPTTATPATRKDQPATSIQETRVFIEGLPTRRQSAAGPDDQGARGQITPIRYQVRADRARGRHLSVSLTPASLSTLSNAAPGPLPTVTTGSAF